ncbi:hypothetical protein SAMN04487948_12561 [Halogranum amylolyticum]|uniref:Uncharacterized protein n=1 Tax=Halogranum amylolyticum TaxID=660520 RepID=A0A1H8W902_9EURY|nr:hypothetical protein [Halogranum amylolyticum]SEP24124.1 hypothetical protein SAMN04487948_12561 [Halogranum amylolyticum]
MFPTRRTFLRTGGIATVALLAGCTAGGDGSTDDPTDEGTPDEPTTSEPTTGEPTTDDLPTDGTPTDDGAGGTRPTGTGGPGITLASVDDAPDLPVTPTVEVTEDTATEDHPPQLRVTVTNDGDEAVQVGEERAVLFAYVTSESGQLTLLPIDGDYPAEPGCWRLTDGVAVTEEYRILTLQPGESVSQLVDVYGAAGGDGCLPVGEHRFESTYTVGRGEDGLAGGDEGRQARWGFSVLLE